MEMCYIGRRVAGPRFAVGQKCGSCGVRRILINYPNPHKHLHEPIHITNYADPATHFMPNPIFSSDQFLAENKAATVTHPAQYFDQSPLHASDLRIAMLQHPLNVSQHPDPMLPDNCSNLLHHTVSHCTNHSLLAEHITRRTSPL